MWVDDDEGKYLETAAFRRHKAITKVTESAQEQVVGDDETW
jgi:hypothetical protein